MSIVIAGGSGFLGSALARALATDGHDVTILTRQSIASRAPAAARRRSSPGRPTAAPARGRTTVNGADAVINLAGESIAAKRWSAAQKQKLRDSRLLATRSLTAAIRQAARPPAVFISGSAVGYYGDRGDETLTEASAPGTDFLAGLAKDWEAAANDVAHAHARRAGSDRHRARSQRRRAAEDAAAVSDVRRRSARLGHAIHAVDTQRRLGADGVVDR